MTDSSILAATWRDGLFVLTGERCHQELAGQAVRSLAPDGHGGALAIVDGHSLCRRTSDRQWSTIATSEFQLACCVAVGEVIYVGTDDARVLRVSAIERKRRFINRHGQERFGAVSDDGVASIPQGSRRSFKSRDSDRMP